MKFLSIILSSWEWYRLIMPNILFRCYNIAIRLSPRPPSQVPLRFRMANSFDRDIPIDVPDFVVPVKQILKERVIVKQES